MIIDIKKKIWAKYPQANINHQGTCGQAYHLDISVSDEEFKALSRVQRHQAIMKLIEKELKSGVVHSVSIQVD